MPIEHSEHGRSVKTGTPATRGRGPGRNRGEGGFWLIVLVVPATFVGIVVGLSVLAS